MGAEAGVGPAPGATAGLGVAGDSDGSKGDRRIATAPAAPTVAVGQGASLAGGIASEEVTSIGAGSSAGDGITTGAMVSCGDEP